MGAWIVIVIVCLSDGRCLTGESEEKYSTYEVCQKNLPAWSTLAAQRFMLAGLGAKIDSKCHKVKQEL